MLGNLIRANSASKATSQVASLFAAMFVAVAMVLALGFSAPHAAFAATADADQPQGQQEQKSKLSLQDKETSDEAADETEKEAPVDEAPAPTKPVANVSITQTASQKNSGKFTVNVNDFVNPIASSVKKVEVVVWSVAGGKDDKATYTPKKVSAGNWKVELSCIDKKRTFGEYSAVCYITLKNGKRYNVGSSTADVEVTPATLKAKLNKAATKVSITANGGILTKAKLVTFSVWSKESGQDDLATYDAKKSNGKYTATVKVAKHTHTGIYNIHVYATINGQSVFIGKTTVEVPPATGTPKVSAKGNGYYKVTVSGVDCAGGVKGVRVAAWTKNNGQDDLVWYPATKSKSGKWSVKVPASKHHGATGKYVSHVYVDGAHGATTFVGSVEHKMEATDYCFVSGDMGSGKRVLCVKNPSKAGNIRFAVWSNTGGQDDVKWVNATKGAGNIWRATYGCYNLSHNGKVIVHAYAGKKFVGAMTFAANSNDTLDGKYRAMSLRVQGLNSSTKYLIAADVSKCFVGVFSGSKGNWIPVKFFPCAPGKPSTPSRRGIFTIGAKGYVFGHGYSCYYYSQYSGDYLFHSIKYYPGTRRVMDGTMGAPASMGCIRLWIENAKWVHDTLPSGTRVLVYG